MNQRIIASAAAVLLAATTSVARADGVYITITGRSVGRIQGPAQYGGRLLGLAFNETTTSAPGAQGTTGRAMPTSYKVTFEWGSALPQLQDAIVTNDVLDMKFEFFTQSGGQDQVYYVVTMSDAHAKDLLLDFDASATPMATITAEFISAQVTSSAPTPSSAGARAGGGAGGAPAGPALAHTLHAPAINLAQGRALMRVASADPTINDAWITVVTPNTFHSEVAGPPAKTAELRSFELEFVAPVDLATGHPSGQHMRKPVAFTKSLGSASPDFQTALQQNHGLNAVTLEFGSRNGMHAAYAINLSDASVAKDQQSMSGGTARESVELRWVHITTSDQATHKQAVDSWSTSN